MMDFTFGKLISDELKLTTHRALRNGLQHRHNIMPLDPEPGESVDVYLVSASDIPIAQASLRYTTDGGDPRASAEPETIEFQPMRREWDTIVWDYVTTWRATIPAQEENTLVTYCISGESVSGQTIHADYPDADEVSQHATMRYFGSIAEDAPFAPTPQHEPPLFCYHVDRVSAPAWVKDAIIYQIFIDRFYPGDGRDWRQTGDMKGFCGGTLWGVRDKLDYLADLGVNALWLSPTWSSPSHHGYDVADYDRVEPRLGGEAALHAVVEGAHRRGIRVLLDLVANHLSNQHPIFLDAARSESSPCRQWFTFDEKYPHGYRSFFNVKTMPKIELENPAARDWMIGNAIKALRDFGVDGFRLDVAAGAGPNFWTHCRPRLREVNPDCILLGEIIDAPDYLRMYRGRLDGCLDFSLNDALRQTYAWKTWDEDRLQAFVESHRHFFGEEFVLPSFVDNHDMDRFLLIADNDAEALKRAAAAQFQLPNPPIILYGTEVGLRQELSYRGRTFDVIRVPMVWDERQDLDMLAFYKSLNRARRSWSVG